MEDVGASRAAPPLSATVSAIETVAVDGMPALRVTLARRYSLLASVRLLRVGPFDPCTHLGRDAQGQPRFVTCARLPSGAATLLATQIARGDGDARPTLLLTAYGPGAAEALLRAPAAVGLCDDPYAFAPAHEGLRVLAEQHRDAHLPRALRISDVLKASVLQQRVTFEEASAAHRELVLRFSEAAPGADALGVRLMLPVDNAILARMPSYEARGAGIDMRRAQILMEAARKARFVDAAQDDLVELRRRLALLPGVGPWTHAYTLGHGAGDADAVPFGDVHLPHTVALALRGDPRANDDDLAEMLAPFAPHRFRAIRLMMEG